MVREETRVQKIARLASKRYPYFGQFARNGNVDIEGLVRFILAKQNELRRVRLHKIGNDARDISYTSGLLKPLSSEALNKIPYLRRREIREQLKSKSYPFSRLNKETREKLLYLPNSWICEGAYWQLKVRKSNRLRSLRKN